MTPGKAMRKPEADAAPMHSPFAEARSFGVGPSTYIVIGFVSAMPLVAAVGLYGDRHEAWSVVCLLSAPLIFIHYCFQKMEFSAGTLTLRRPFLRDKSVALSTVTSVNIALVLARGRPQWKCVMTGGEKLLFEFNPKPYPFEAIDFMVDQVRAYSPNASITDGTLVFRPKPRH